MYYLYRYFVRYVSALIPSKRWRKKFRTTLLKQGRPAFFDHQKGFKAYVFSHAMDEIVAALKSGLDLESQKVVDAKIADILNWPERSYCAGLTQLIKQQPITPFLNKAERRIHRQFFSRDLQQIIKTYTLNIPNYSQEVFLFHHGLKELPETVKTYICDRDFFDVGAYVGDSILVLREYGPRKIYAFEASPKALSELNKNMQTNHIPPSLYSLEEYLLGGQEGTVYTDTHSYMVSTSNTGKTEIPMKRLDSFLDTADLDLGLIKMDIEGEEMNVLASGVKLLQKHRPVVVCAIYHTPEQFFELKPYLESILPDYVFRIRNLSTIVFPRETTLIAYPKELQQVT